MASVTSAPTAMRRRARRTGRALPAVLTLAVVGGLSWWGWTKTHPADDPNSKMITAKVTRGDLIETVIATGSVTAQTGAQVKIGSQITGRIKKLNADVGSYVHANAIIAELDLPDIEAQLNQAQANLETARTRLMQQQTGVTMQNTQTSSAVADAKAALASARARLAAALASARLQTSQTPNDIKRAETALAVTQAALSTAKSNQAQVQASANLQIANAHEQLNQAQANATNSALNLKRQQELLSKGFVAQSVVDAAQAASSVNQSQVKAAQQNIQLVKEKVTADVQAAQDQTAQAQQNIAAAQAALSSAQAGPYQDAARQADVDSARAQVNQAQANLQLALGNVTQNTLKQQDILQAREAVRAAQAQVAYNQAQRDKTFIRSPISGTVLQMAAQQGETLAAGLSAPTLIVVADLKRLQVDVFVDETDIGKIRLGQEAKVTVDAYPKKIFPGKVVKIASGSTIQQGVVTYDVTVTISDPQHRLKPDMTASVTIETGKRTDVVLVPAEAVKVGVRGSIVNVLTKKDGKSTVDPRKVKTGASDGAKTEIRDGLKEGETIVLAGMDSGTKRPTGGGGPFGGGGGGGGRGGR